MPLEDLECQTCADGADEEQSGVILVDDVLVKAWNAIVVDFDIGKEGERPGVACAEDEFVDICDGRAVGEVDGSLASGGVDVGD